MINQLLTESKLERENQKFSGTSGVSHANRSSGFIPAFYDTETKQVEISRFHNGQPAPIHVIDGLPESWIVERNADSKAIAVKCSVIAGFIRDGLFYTRAQAAEAAENRGQTTV